MEKVKCCWQEFRFGFISNHTSHKHFERQLFWYVIDTCCSMNVGPLWGHLHARGSSDCSMGCIMLFEGEERVDQFENYFSDFSGVQQSQSNGPIRFICGREKHMCIWISMWIVNVYMSNGSLCYVVFEHINSPIKVPFTVVLWIFASKIQ